MEAATDTARPLSPAAGLVLAPADRARRTLSRGQARLAALVTLATLIGLIANPLVVAVVVLAGITAAFLAVATLRCAYAVRGLGVHPPQMPALADEDLPSYTVVVALFQEEQAAAHLCRSLAELDYPRDRLQVIFACESGDYSTIRACQAHADPDWDILIVPPGHPRTKPRALNAALELARGELLTIYDAEDRPDPRQLRDAAASFAVAGAEVAALQARLDVYNERESIVTRCFTVDYLTLFGAVLPGLADFRHPMPLGGTSTHLRADVLREVGGWDAWNVTEDCDLGMRLAVHGYTSQMLDSVTMEEAVPTLRGWLRQRSRWVKGYAQTAVVLLRDPLATSRAMGARNYAAALVTVGGLPLVLLAQIITWLLLLAYFVVRATTGDDQWLEPLFPEPLGSLSFAVLVAGMFSVLVMHATAVHRQRRYELVWVVLLLPFYLLAASVAAWWGCAQLVRRPHHWEKTSHDTSRDDLSLPTCHRKAASAASATHVSTVVAPSDDDRASRLASPALGAALAATLGALAGALVLSWGDLLAFSDAPSHLLTARRVFDNTAPGVDQLGLHWLPLYHVLELPVIWIDPLYRTGLAGSAVSMLGALITVGYLYRLTRECGASDGRALAACLALLAAPSFLYAGVVPMHYTLITATSCVSVFYLVRWIRGQRDLDLLLCALALTAATLTHFETWVLVPLEAAVLLAIGLRSQRARLPGDFFLWAIAGCFGVAFFLTLNIWWDESPVAFLRGFEGSGDVLATSHKGFGRLADHPHAVWTLAGPLLVIAGTAGAVAYAWSRRREPGALAALLLFAPVVFFAAQALTTGSLIEPGAELTDWRNLRYAITLLPALAFGLAMVPLRGVVVWALVVLAVLAGGNEVMTGRVAAHQDAKHDVPNRTAVTRAASDWIRRAPQGAILLPVHSSAQDRLQLQSGLPSSRFIDDNDTVLLRDLLARPSELARSGVRWIATLPVAGGAAPELSTELLSAAKASPCRVFRDAEDRPAIRIWGVGGCG
jgi:cellulose synthase/poly-beta-1,6-N-acetylglucosamine synthase-like glycosyltransferase